MIKSLSNCIVNQLVKKDVINDEVEIYQYGLELLISSFIGVTAILLISVLYNRIIEGLIYLSSFILIRKYTGGYHCKSYFACKSAFIGTFIIYLFLGDYLEANLILHIIFITSFITIWILAPCDHENKTLTAKEVYRYKKISKGILCMYLLIIYLLNQHSSYYVLHMELMLIIIAVLLIMGKLERRKTNEKNQCA